MGWGVIDEVAIRTWKGGEFVGLEIFLKLVILMVLMAGSGAAQEWDVQTIDPKVFDVQQAINDASVLASDEISEVRGEKSCATWGKHLGSLVYSEDQASEEANKFRGALMERLSGELPAPLFDYFRTEYPSPSFDTFTLEYCSGERFVEASSLKEHYASVQSLMEQMRNFSSTTLDVRIRSDPSDAEFRLFRLDGALVGSIKTEDVVANLYRGRYNYTLRKSGYQEVPLTAIDFLDDPDSERHFVLTPDAAPGDGQN